MPSSTFTDSRTRLVHFLDLDEYGLNDVPEEFRGEAKREVADYLKNEVLRFLDRGTSPVAGEGRFKILDTKYAKREKGGVKTSNLELEGDLKDSLIVEPSTGSFIKFGHEGSQTEKADGHNQISSRAQRWAASFDGAPFPKRRYIPDSGQRFTDSITSEVKKIINDFKRLGPEPERPGLADDEAEDFDFQITTGTRTSSTESPRQREAGLSFVDIDNLFSDDVIEDLLADALRRRR
jgi:hypothetical protein